MKNKRNRSQAIASLAFAVGGGIGYVTGVQSLQWIALVVLALVGAFGLVRGAQYLYSQLRGPIIPTAPGSSRVSDSKRDWRWITNDEDLAAYQALADLELDDRGYAPVDKLKKKLAINGKLVWGGSSLVRGVWRLEGFFVVYPLTRRATEKFVGGIWDNGRSLEPSHIARTWGSAASIYISGIAGLDTPAKARIFNDLHQYLRGYNGLPVFARAATLLGEKKLIGFKFRPIVDELGVWVLPPVVRS